jgi:hypothetical protein
MAKFIELTEIEILDTPYALKVKKKVKVNVDNIVFYKGCQVFLKDGTSLIVDEEYDQITKLIERPTSIGVIHEAANNLVNGDWLSRHKERHHAAINQFPHFAERRVGFVVGAEWGDKTMLDKATEWLKKNKDNPLIKCEDPCLSGYLTDEFIEDFRKAMKE